MLKWTVLSRRDPDNNKRLSLNLPSSTESLPQTPQRQKTKRRRSSTVSRHQKSAQKRYSLDALEADKENTHQFHSTPIKNSSSIQESFSPFRDLSNLTSPPTGGKEKIISTRSSRTSSIAACKKSPKLLMKVKKKKECLENHKIIRVSNESNYFTPFEAVDSHIESILAEELCSCKKITKTITKRNEEEENIPLSVKKTKIIEANIDDIIGATAAENLPGFRPNNNKKLLLAAKEEVRVTPLVNKFVDLRFSRISLDKKAHNDSSFINEMSYDKLVDVLLENSISATNDDTSMIVHIDHKENNISPSKEEEDIHQEQNVDINSEVSSDSGFKSSTNENSHQLDNNFQCKCSQNLLSEEEEDTTIIQLTTEPYNERCVDVEISRKRTSSITPSSENADNAKKPKIDDNNADEEACTLKRQRCIRKKKAENLRKKLSRINNSSIIESATVSPFWSKQKVAFHHQLPSDEESFTPSSTVRIFQNENTPLRGCYMESKGILETTPRIIRKCLMFDSPKINNESINSFADSTGRSNILDVRGSMDLRIISNEDGIFVNVIRCKDLYKGDGETINAYIKIAINDHLTSRCKKKNAVLQRTAVQSNSSRPIFNHTFRFLKLPAEDSKKRIHIEVWHRERAAMTSEFLGCMSFDVQDAYNKIIQGSFKLLPQSEGRLSNLQLINDQINTMGDSNQEEVSVFEEAEVLSLDGGVIVETELKRSSTTNKATLSEQQKYADEHLFLRYLELDPLEGPDAIPAATQRKATGNKFGRTPFTHTKRLIRSAKSGFGFSVVWTHPPRIERVEKGLPAERAGILPGDYIIFVDKHNVVMMPEIDILNLVRSYGSQLTLEIFRRNSSRNGSVPTNNSVHLHHQNQKFTTIVTPSSLKTDSNVNLPNSSTSIIRRPSTVCSTNATSVEYRKRKLNLPQVTFSSETCSSTSPEESRRRAIYQLIGKEQQYATALQFSITRFVSALAERNDLINLSEHKTLFQNCEEILRITEDILDHLVHDDGEMDPNMLVKIYRCKLHEITTAYKKYCAGIKKADCVLANKMKNSNSDFVRFIQCPAIPRRRPDLTTFIHKPLEHYRETLKILMAIQSHTSSKHEDSPVINQVIHEMQITYREITSEGGLMEPIGEGRPLLSVQDLENRLVFTKCKPFILNKPGRQWIFGGDLSRIEGRNVRQYWTLLFNDLLIFAKASRDRVLFITEDPLPLAHVTDMYFNIRKKDTEFRICVDSDNQNNKAASSPTIHCGPDLTRTPRKNANKKTVILRAPTTELKAVWQNLLQRQILQLNSGLDGSALSSPLESPEVPINSSSVGTLQSVDEISSIRRHQRQNVANDSSDHHQHDGGCSIHNNDDVKKQLETLIEHKCKQMEKTSFNGKCNAIHLEQWMKGQLLLQNNSSEPISPVVEQIQEVWSDEKLRKRSEELQLVDSNGDVSCSSNDHHHHLNGISACEESILSDQEEQSPSKSTTNESQVTVRSSPIVPETVPVCRQCHKNCLSNILTNNTTNNNEHNQNNFKDCTSSNNNNHQAQLLLESAKTQNNNWSYNENGINHQDDDSNWQQFMLLGICANPLRHNNLVKLDPFNPPKISVAPPTPENSVKSNESDNFKRINSSICYNGINCHVSSDISPDDSPLTEEPPYHSLSSSAQTSLRRFGTVSSLERFCSDDNKDIICCENNHFSSEDGDDSEEEEEDDLGIENEGFENPHPIVSWTTRAGNYVVEKMAFFEKLGEDYRSGGTTFFDRYLKSDEDKTPHMMNGEELQEEETSGGTSGEEIWGTPTSGDLDDPSLHSPSSPNYDNNDDGKLSFLIYSQFSPNNDGSYSSDTLDDTELMMDELLMAPPITGAILRGLLPRRTLEPLIEEDFSDTTSSSSSSSSNLISPQSESSTQGSQSGSVADILSPDAVLEINPKEKIQPEKHHQLHQIQKLEDRLEIAQINGQMNCVEEVYEEVKDSQMETSLLMMNMPRSESYKKIVEAAEDSVVLLEATTVNNNNSVCNVEEPEILFQHFRPAVKFVNNIERVHRYKSFKIFEFFNMRRSERRVYERYPENSPLLLSGNSGANSSAESSPSHSPNKCPKEFKDSRNGRFWRQLSRRRRRSMEKSSTNNSSTT